MTKIVIDEPNFEKKLNNITLTELSNKINSEEYKTYFLSPFGKEHYILLAYMSTWYNNSVILDIGTLKGCSALALAYNSTNKIKSFNITNQLDLNDIPENIEFIVDDILNEKYKDLILSSKIILLDTYHDGTFEKKFHDYLNENKWEGILILDDIKLNQEMIDYWDNIEEPKLDITKYGHWSGTGIVDFNNYKNL